jgi:uncharacterized protein
MNEIAFIICAFAASVISGIVGFGTGLLLISIGSFFYDIKETIVLANIFFIGVTISRTFLYWRDIDWKLLGLVFAAGLPMIFIGANLLIPIDDRIVRLILGISILFYVANNYMGFTKNIRTNNLLIVTGGGLWGFLGGLVGDGNVIKAALFDHIGIRKEAFVATMASTSLVGNFIKYAIYKKLDYASQDNIAVIAILLVLAFLGSLVGKNILNKMDSETFRKVVLIFLGLISLKLILF